MESGSDRADSLDGMEELGGCDYGIFKVVHVGLGLPLVFLVDAS